jgi:hypothetical protein
MPGTVWLLLLHWHVLHAATAGFDCGAKHGVVAALRADMLHFGVLACAFAGSDDFDGAIAGVAHDLLTNRHHFDVRLVGGDFLDHDGFALGASHGHGVAGLQCFRLRLGRDVLHQRHVIRPLCVVRRVVRCASRAGQPSRDRQGERESRTEPDFTEELVFRFHNCVFQFAVVCLFRC